MSDREIAGLVFYGIFLTGMYFLYSEYIKKTEAKQDENMAVIIAKLEGLATQEKAKGRAK